MSSRAPLFRRVPTALFRRVQQEILVADPSDSGDAIICIDGPGAEAWELFERARSIRDVSQILALRYPAPVINVARDIAAFTCDLVAHGLIERVE